MEWLYGTVRNCLCALTAWWHGWNGKTDVTKCNSLVMWMVVRTTVAGKVAETWARVTYASVYMPVGTILPVHRVENHSLHSCEECYGCLNYDIKLASVWTWRQDRETFCHLLMKIYPFEPNACVCQGGNCGSHSV